MLRRALLYWLPAAPASFTTTQALLCGLEQVAQLDAERGRDRDEGREAWGVRRGFDRLDEAGLDADNLGQLRLRERARPAMAPDVCGEERQRRSHRIVHGLRQAFPRRANANTLNTFVFLA